jgi:hypothetical protein
VETAFAGLPVSSTSTLRRARPSTRAALRPAGPPPTITASSVGTRDPWSEPRRAVPLASRVPGRRRGRSTWDGASEARASRVSWAADSNISATKTGGAAEIHRAPLRHANRCRRRHRPGGTPRGRGLEERGPRGGRGRPLPGCRPDHGRGARRGPGRGRGDDRRLEHGGDGPRGSARLLRARDRSSARGRAASGRRASRRALDRRRRPGRGQRPLRGQAPSGGAHRGRPDPLSPFSVPPSSSISPRWWSGGCGATEWRASRHCSSSRSPSPTRPRSWSRSRSERPRVSAPSSRAPRLRTWSTWRGAP